MADKISLEQIKTDNTLILDNSAPDDSITPSVDDDLRSNQLDTSANYGVNKFKIFPVGVPSIGEITVNNSFDSATEISIFKINNHLFDVSGSLGVIGSGSVISLRDEEGNFGEFGVTGITDNTTYFTYTVTANPSNPSHTPTGKFGYVTIIGGAGGGGGGGNIIDSDNTQTALRQQDLSGFTQIFKNGILALKDNALQFNVVGLGNSGVAKTVDFSTGNMFSLIATGNFTLSFSNLAPMNFTIKCTQDGTGSRVITGGANVVWGGGVVKLLSTTAGAIDIINGWCDGTNIYLSIENDWS